VIDGTGRRLRALVPAAAIAALAATLLSVSIGSVLAGDASVRARDCPDWVSSPPASTARRAVWIIIDAVRADIANDPRIMPALVAAARRGGSGEARVDSLMPSTVAGIQALATGRSPPPLSIFEDFGTERSREGGVFAALRATGRRAFVVGPHLWEELYGPWLAGATTVRTIGSDDDFLERAALTALDARTHDLVVVHFGACDEATHRFGGESARYRACVAAYDARLARLFSRIAADTALVVTADHGASPIGGHVGPETWVLRTPLVTLGPGVPHGALGTTPQTCVGRIVARAIGVDLPRFSSKSVDGTGGGHGVGRVDRPRGLRGRVPEGAGPSPWLVGIAALGVLATMFWGLARGLGGAGKVYRTLFRVYRTLLILAGAAACAGLWRIIDALPTTEAAGAQSALVTSLANAGPLVALAFAVFWVARRFRRAARTATSAVFRTRRRVGAYVALLALASAGLALGGVETALFVVGIFLVGFALAALAPHETRSSAWLGMASAVLAATLARFLGENVSLSTTDVRAAYALIDGPLGLGGASAAYALRMMLPSAALCAGLSAWFARARPRVLRAFAAGAAVALVCTMLPAVFVLVDAGAQHAWRSLAVSAVLRGLGELVFFFIAALASTALAHRRSTTRAANPRVAQQPSIDP
jgi:hypothetical protein